MRSSGAIKSASPLMSIMESAAFVYASRSISVTMLTSERFSSIFIAAFGSDPSVYVLLYMLDFDAADVVDYAAS